MSRTRTRKSKANRPKTKPCEYCGRIMTPGRVGRRRFCTAACKQGAYRQRLAERVTVTMDGNTPDHTP